MSIMNLLISFDDPMERLIRGEPDPFLAQFECRLTPEDVQRILDDLGLTATPEQVQDISDETESLPDPDPPEAQSDFPATTGPDHDGDDFGADAVHIDGGDGGPTDATVHPLREISARSAEIDGSEGELGSERDDRDRERLSLEDEDPLVIRLRAEGLTEAQIASALARYRDPRGPGRSVAVTTGLASAADPATALLGAGALGESGPPSTAATPADRARQLATLNERLEAAQEAGANPAELRQIADDYDALATGYQGTGEMSAGGLPLS